MVGSCILCVQELDRAGGGSVTQEGHRQGRELTEGLVGRGSWKRSL